MIVFDLKCSRDHVFEAWFQDSGTFEAQAGAGLVECPVCNDTEITKDVMAPHVSSVTRRKSDGLSPVPQAMSTARTMHVLGELRRQVEDNCDYVGEDFAEEARKIHYGEVEKRNIYGEATQQDAAELEDEGVEFNSIPWPDDHDA